MNNEQFKALLMAKKETDPTSAYQMMGEVLAKRYIEAFSANGAHPHAESVVTFAATLAGYSCQAALRESHVINGDKELENIFTVTETVAKGEGVPNRFFVGPLIRQVLLEDSQSLYQLSLATAKQLGAEEEPDIVALYQSAITQFGAKEYGQLVYDGNQPYDQPLTYLKDTWSGIENILKSLTDDPLDWSRACAYSVINLQELTKTVITPSLCLSLILASAIPCALVDIDSYKVVAR